jgi:hypothetical protein
MKEKRINKKKLSLDELKVHSFVTSIREDETRRIKGGENVEYTKVPPGYEPTSGTSEPPGSFLDDCSVSWLNWCTAGTSPCN